jgi:putative membrane protein
MIDLVICLLGMCVGLLLGLVPGMHINNFLPFFILLSFTNPQLFFFVIAASMAYVFSSFFPAILLGVPNEDTALNVLPGHRMVLEGNAYSAVMVSLAGGLLVVLFSMPFLFFFLNALPLLYPALQKIVPYMLIIILLFMFLSDKKQSVIVLALSSVLGFLTFDFNLLLPLLTGFFGLSTLLISILNDSLVSPQVMRFDSRLSLTNLSTISFISCFLSSIFGFIPAISSSIVGTMASYIRKFDSEEFLVLLSGTNVAYMIYSFFALILINKTRSGSAVFLSQIFEKESIFFVLGIILLSSALAFLICFYLAKPLVRLYKRLDYRKLSLLSIFFIIAVNFALAGPFGLIVLLASTSIGLLSNSLGVKRINCMAALIVPTIVVLI